MSNQKEKEKKVSNSHSLVQCYYEKLETYLKRHLWCLLQPHCDMPDFPNTAMLRTSPRLVPPSPACSQEVWLLNERERLQKSLLSGVKGNLVWMELPLATFLYCLRAFPILPVFDLTCMLKVSNQGRDLVVAWCLSKSPFIFFHQAAFAPPSADTWLVMVIKLAGVNKMIRGLFISEHWNRRCSRL